MLMIVGGYIIILIAFCFLCCWGNKKKDEKELDELDKYKEV